MPWANQESRAPIKKNSTKNYKIKINEWKNC